MGPFHETVLEMLSIEPLTETQVADRTGVSTRDAAHALQTLIAAGEVSRDGNIYRLREGGPPVVQAARPVQTQETQTMPKKTKTCRRCEQELDLDQFGDDSRTPDGKAKVCRSCRVRPMAPEKKAPAKTLKAVVQLLSTVLAWGAARDWLPTNPLLGFRKGPKARRMRYITDGELAAILAACDPPLALLVRFMHYTAARRSDVFNLKWDAFDDEGLHLKTQKTGAAILFRWGPQLRAIYDEARRKPVIGMYVFSGPRGAKLKPEREWARFKAAAARAGVKGVTFHDLRRKRLTDYQARELTDLAQKVAGHTDARTTRGYYAAPETVVELG